jgi:putative FmdB family regulatory protein
MPIYEYTCPKCGEFEVTQRITDDPLKKCPTCKSTKIKKLISSTSFHLKGTGWYVTDYARKDGGGAKTPADGKGESKSDSKAESKSDSSAKETSSKSSEGKSSSKTEKASQAA